MRARLDEISGAVSMHCCVAHHVGEHKPDNKREKKYIRSSDIFPDALPIHRNTLRDYTPTKEGKPHVSSWICAQNSIPSGNRRRPLPLPASKLLTCASFPSGPPVPRARAFMDRFCFFSRHGFPLFKPSLRLRQLLPEFSFAFSSLHNFVAKLVNCLVFLLQQFQQILF